MAVLRNEEFTNQRLVIDGNRYESCTFTECSLVYEGGELPAFDNCKFKKTSLQPTGAASNTLAYLNELYNSGMWRNVDGVIDRVKTGTLALPNRPLPCDAADVGTNYGRLFAGLGFLATVTVLLMLALWYGLLFNPQENILGEDQPLRAEIPLSVMPVLPENLAEVYDLTDQTAEDVLDTYGYVDEERTVARVPIEMAFEMLIDEGLPTWNASGG